MTSNPTVLELLPKGLPWPSGGYVEVALLNVQGVDVSRSIGGELSVGDEPGLGSWQAIGARLKSGAVIELIEHIHQPTKGFALRVDRGFGLGATLDETLAALGIGKESVLWRSPLIQQ